MGVEAAFKPQILICVTLSGLLCMFVEGSSPSAALRGNSRELLTLFNVTKTATPDPPSYVYVATILIPVFIIGLAVVMGTLCSIASLKILSGQESAAVVLTSDFNEKGNGGPIKVDTMYDWAIGQSTKADKSKQGEVDEVKQMQSQEDRMRMKRQRKVVDQVLTVIRDNMINLRLTPLAIFNEFDTDHTGELSYWEFTKGLERLGVKLSDARMEMIMKDLDTDGGGNISLSEFENALALNAFRAQPTMAPDVWTPMDPVWNKIYHSLGSPDALAVARIFDPEDTGAVGRDRFLEILRSHDAEVTARQLDLVGELLDPLETGVMDIEKLASNLSSSARRLEATLLTKLFAAVEAHGGTSFFDGYAHAESRLISYNAMQMLCDDLDTGISSEELVLLFSSLDTNDNGHVPLDVLIYSMVSAWSATTTRIWLQVRKSPLGQLRGEQAARVLCMNKAWVSYPDFASGLAENGIDLSDEDLLLLMVQLGSTVDGVVHAVDFANAMDHEMSLALHSAYSKITSVLGMDNIILEDALAKLDERENGYINHTQLVEFLHTFDIGLANEDLTMILARLDSENQGRIDIPSFIKDVNNHIQRNEAWAKISESLGPSGGAQLATFVGESTALATSALLAAFRQLGIDLTDEEFELCLQDLDPRHTQYCKVEEVVLLIRAHRERVTFSAWLKVISEFPTGHDAVISVVEAAQGAKVVFTYEQIMAGLVNKCSIPVSEAEVRTLLLSLDPNDTGAVRASALEHGFESALATKHKGDYKEVASSSRVNVMQVLEDAQKELTALNAKPLHSEDEKIRIHEMTQHCKLLESTIKQYNKVQKELAVLSGKRKAADYEKARLEEVQRHSRMNIESVRQMSKIQAELTKLTGIGALGEQEKLRLATLRKQAREVNDMVGRSIKLQIDLAALNVRAIAKSGLSEAELARRTVLRENLEPLATEIRLAETKRDENLDSAVKRANIEAEGKSKKVVQLWKDLAEHMRRRHITAKKLYRQFDESGSGELNYWDFFKGIQSIGIIFDEDDTDLLMADIDKEETGIVSLAKFSEKLKDQDPQRQVRRAAKLQALKEKKQRKLEKEASVTNAFFSFFGTPPDEDSGDDDDEVLKTSSEEEEEEEEEEVEVKSNNKGNTGHVLEAGTPVMAMHTTGDYFRATVVKDNLDGTCEVQFVLATLGRDMKLSKKKVRSLAQEEEVRQLWLQVSRTVGRRGGTELRSKTDFGGNISHEALMAWLESRDLGEISEHEKYVFLADIDPLHTGVVHAVRFLEKLEHFRARAKLMNLTVFHRHDKETLHEDEEEEEEEHAGQGVEMSAGANKSLAGASDVPTSAVMSAASQSRMTDIEALIFAMAKRQQELALALSASEARTASLNAAVQSIKDEPVYGGEPLLGAQSNAAPGGLYIMPDAKDGQLTWLNKNTGMRFVRQDIAAIDVKKKKKGRKTTKARKTAAPADGSMV